jgi:hypothetical protein
MESRGQVGPVFQSVLPAEVTFWLRNAGRLGMKPSLRTRPAVALVHLAEAGQPGQSAFEKKD